MYLYEDTVGSVGGRVVYSMHGVYLQDAVWTWGQVMSGCFLLILVYRYGPLAFRRDVVNKVRTENGLTSDALH